MYGRMFKATFNDVAIAAAQDVFYIKAGATQPILIHSVNLSQKTLTAWEAKNIRFQYKTGSVTAGTGGAAVTPRGSDAGGMAAASATTVRANDATTAATATTTTDEWSEEWVFTNGFLWVPADPRGRILVKPTDGLVVRLDTAPSGSMTASGSIEFEEIG